jgi:hypothetical protein
MYCMLSIDRSIDQCLWCDRERHVRPDFDCLNNFSNINYIRFRVALASVRVIVTTRSLKNLGIVTTRNLKNLGIVKTRNLKNLGIVTTRNLKNLGIVTTRNLKTLGIVTTRNHLVIVTTRNLNLRFENDWTGSPTDGGNVYCSFDTLKTFLEIK